MIKVGLSPILIDLVEKGAVSALAFNGAGIIHDFELAYAGKTSEDVAATLHSGDFGMARETGEFLGEAVRRAHADSVGLGKAVGRLILEKDLPYADISLLATAAKADIPATVHVAFGTDILHMHPGFDPAKAGAATHLDFRTFASVVSTLEKGVYMNIGSAVLLPEVFLKAVTLVRNLGHRVENFTAVNLDFISHYRPLTNVVRRPTPDRRQGLQPCGLPRNHAAAHRGRSLGKGLFLSREADVACGAGGAPADPAATCHPAS